MPAALDDIVSEYVHYNVSMYRRTFFLSRNWLTVRLSQVVNSWHLIDILLTMNLKQNFRL